MATKKAPSKTAKKKSSLKSDKGNVVLINFVLDKSGSMASTLNDTIGGFNTYIKQLKEDKNSSYLFSLTLFDTTLENRHVAVDLNSVPELNHKTYVPGGMTALHDAIGRTVLSVEQSGKKYDKCLTVILTDGAENSSREYKLQAVKDLIARKEKEGNWTFVFLGADLSAFAAGDSMGIAMSNSVAYNPQNMGATYATTACATINLASSNLLRSRDFYSSVPKRAMAASGMSRRTEPKHRRPGNMGLGK